MHACIYPHDCLHMPILMHTLAQTMHSEGMLHLEEGTDQSVRDSSEQFTKAAHEYNAQLLAEDPPATQPKYHFAAGSSVVQMSNQNIPKLRELEQEKEIILEQVGQGACIHTPRLTHSLLRTHRSNGTRIKIQTPRKVNSVLSVVSAWRLLKRST